MTTKEKFLNNLLSKIKVLQDAYNYNKNLPDDVFESLSGDVVPKIKPANGTSLAPHSEKEYGANINAVRDLLKSNSDGMVKSDIIDNFPDASQYDPAELYTIVTNVLSSLNKGGEVEKYKPVGKKMRGYFWKIKNVEY